MIISRDIPVSSAEADGTANLPVLEIIRCDLLEELDTSVELFTLKTSRLRESRANSRLVIGSPVIPGMGRPLLVVQPSLRCHAFRSNHETLDILTDLWSRIRDRISQ